LPLSASAAVMPAREAQTPSFFKPRSTNSKQSNDGVLPLERQAMTASPQGEAKGLRFNETLEGFLVVFLVTKVSLTLQILLSVIPKIYKIKTV
jgi:hypothetical protein